MIRLPGHEPLSVELPKPPRYMLVLYCLVLLVYAAFAALTFAALALGVYWLWQQVVA